VLTEQLERVITNWAANSGPSQCFLSGRSAACMMQRLIFLESQPACLNLHEAPADRQGGFYIAALAAYCVATATKSEASQHMTCIILIRFHSGVGSELSPLSCCQLAASDALIMFH